MEKKKNTEKREEEREMKNCLRYSKVNLKIIKIVYQIYRLLL